MRKHEIYWALDRAFNDLDAHRRDIRAAAQRTPPDILEDIDDGLRRLDDCLAEAVVEINRLFRKI